MSEQFKIVIGLSGKQGAGKDHLCKLLLKKLGRYGFERGGCADIVKHDYYDTHFSTRKHPHQYVSHADKIAYVDSVKHLPEVRKGLQEVGAELRTRDIDYLPRAVLDDYGPYVIVPDMRYLSEVEYFKANADLFYSVRVDSERVNRAARRQLSNEDHVSETELDTFDFWHAIENNGSEAQLEAEARLLVSKLYEEASDYFMKESVKLLRLP